MLSHSHLFLNIFVLIYTYLMITNIFFFSFCFTNSFFHQVCLVMNIYVTTVCFVFRKKKARALCYMSLRNHQQNILYHHVIRQWKGFNLSKITVETNDYVSFKLWIKATRRCVTSYFTLFENKNDLIISMLLDSHMVMVTSLESLQTAGSFLWKQFSWKAMISALFWKVTVTDLMDFETQRNPCNSFLQKLHYVLTLQKTIVL